MADAGSIAIGAVIGFVIGMLLFTDTGKALTGLAGEEARRAKRRYRRNGNGHGTPREHEVIHTTHFVD